MSNEQDKAHRASGRRVVVHVPARVRRRESEMGDTNVHYDDIQCSGTGVFDQLLTPPPELWCNNDDCLDAFGNVFTVHTIDCDSDACDVQVHCNRQLDAIRYACMLTFLAVLVMIAFATFNKRALRKELRNRAQRSNVTFAPLMNDPYAHANKRV